MAALAQKPRRQDAYFLLTGHCSRGDGLNGGWAWRSPCMTDSEQEAATNCYF